MDEEKILYQNEDITVIDKKIIITGRTYEPVDKYEQGKLIFKSCTQVVHSLWINMNMEN